MKIPRYICIKKKTFYVVLIWLIAVYLIFTFGRLLEKQETFTAGMSQVVATDYGVLIDNGFVRSLSDNEIDLWLLGMNANITILALNPVELHLNILNVGKDAILLIDNNPQEIKPKDKQFSLDLSIDGGQQKIITVSNPQKYAFCFAALGDVHGNFGPFFEMMYDINQKNLSFSVVNGDLVNEGRKRLFYLFIDAIADFEQPVFTSIGNHDIWSGGKEVYKDLLGETYYSFEYGNSYFIIVDSAEGNVDEQQYRWLENELRTAKERDKNIFVFTHIPPLNPESAEWKAGGRMLREIFKFDANFFSEQVSNRFSDLMTNYDVKIVFDSHIHKYFSWTKENTSYVTTGPAGGNLLSKDASYDYVQVCVNGSNVTQEMVDFGAPSQNFFIKTFTTARLFAYDFIKGRQTESILLTIVTFVAVLVLVIVNRKSKLVHN